jgi:hypothetical protein
LKPKKNQWEITRQQREVTKNKKRRRALFVWEEKLNQPELHVRPIVNKTKNLPVIPCAAKRRHGIAFRNLPNGGALKAIPDNRYAISGMTLFFWILRRAEVKSASL